MNSEDGQADTAEAGLSLIMERFPDEVKALRRLFQESLSFQSLCEDYRECLAAQHHWQQSSSKEASARQDEYAFLLLELEQEVREYLRILADCSAGPG